MGAATKMNIEELTINEILSAIEAVVKNDVVSYENLSDEDRKVVDDLLG